MLIMQCFVSSFNIATCKAGAYSPTGLEPCFPCDKGYYQQLEGQKNCIQCGENTTTSDEGSNSSMQCGGITFQQLQS